MLRPSAIEILKTSIPHVPAFGFNAHAISAAHPSLSPLTISQLFPGGVPAALATTWLSQQLDALEDDNDVIKSPQDSDLRITAIKKRLSYNEPVKPHLPDALATLPLPNGYTEHVFSIADTICHRTNFSQPGLSWYSNRFRIASIYAGAELFSISDSSMSQTETFALVDRLSSRSDYISSALSDTAEFSLYSLKSIPAIFKNLYIYPGSR